MQRPDFLYRLCGGDNNRFVNYDQSRIFTDVFYGSLIYTVLLIDLEENTKY